MQHMSTNKFKDLPPADKIKLHKIWLKICGKTISHYATTAKADCFLREGKKIGFDEKLLIDYLKYYNVYYNEIQV